MIRSVLSLVFFSFFTFSFSSQASAFSVSYDQKVTVENNVIATVKVVVQDNHMSAQSNFSGIESIILRNESGSYSYIPAQKMATKIPAAMDRPNLTRDLPRFMDFLNQNAGKKIGSETLEGKACDIYQFTEPTLKRDAKAWVWTEKQFPLKIEVPAPEGLTIVELSNIQFDPVISADQFKLPADVQIIDLEATQSVPTASLGEEPSSVPSGDAPSALQAE